MEEGRSGCADFAALMQTAETERSCVLLTWWPDSNPLRGLGGVAAVAGIRLRRTGPRMGRRHQKGTPFRGRLFGAGGRTRTGTGLLPEDFKSPVSTVPPHRRVLIIYHGRQDSSSRTRWTDCTRRAYTTPVCAPVRNDEAFFLGYVISSGVEKSKRRLLYRLHRLRSFDSLALAQDDTRNLPT